MMKRMKSGYTVYLGIALLFFLSVTAVCAETEVGGSIASNSTWDLTGSPYIVTNNVTVESGVTLTLESGVEVKFNSETGLSVSGTLNASGTELAPVSFTSNQLIRASGDWSGIKFASGAFETAGFDPNGQLAGVDFTIVAGEGYFIYMK